MSFFSAEAASGFKKKNVCTLAIRKHRSAHWVYRSFTTLLNSFMGIFFGGRDFCSVLSERVTPPYIRESIVTGNNIPRARKTILWHHLAVHAGGRALKFNNAALTRGWYCVALRYNGNKWKMLPVTILLTYLVPTTPSLVRFIKLFFFSFFFFLLG